MNENIIHELCTPSEIAEYIGQTSKNIKTTYRDVPKKINHYNCLQIGTALAKDEITDLKVFMEMVKTYKCVYRNSTLKLIDYKKSINNEE